MIPMVDLRAQYESLRAELEPAMSEAMAACQYILGPNVAAFEGEVADYLGAGHAIACASGTDALMLALRASGVGPGHEVVTTPFTFIATAEAIRYVGAEPVFADIEAGGFNLDVDAVEAALTPATRAVLPVHLFGQPVDMARLRALTAPRGIAIVEDCAQSFGARTPQGMTGTLGDAGAFSFFPSKNLGAFGDGGLVTTQDAATAERLRALRNHGQFARYRHDTIGYNSRLDELQAVVLRHNLGHIDSYNAERRRVADRYDAGLAEAAVGPPPRPGAGSEHVFHQYTLRCRDRDRLQAGLREAEIASAIYYPVPLHRQPVFAADHGHRSLPNAELAAACCLSLPIYPELDDATVDRIAATVRAVEDG
jgi:dTDP-4-amino-4,6-dideoxygalactose transaminase